MIPRINWLKSSFVNVGIVSLFCSLTAHAEYNISQEQRLKAAYLLNFTIYITWPKEQYAEPEHPVVLCIHSDDAFFEFAKSLAAGDRFANKKHRIKVESLHDAQHCQMTYIKERIQTLPPQMAKTLIVADSENVKQNNTAITFFTSNRKLRFEIDLSVVEETQVSVSSELLKLAKIKRS